MPKTLKPKHQFGLAELIIVIGIPVNSLLVLEDFYDTFNVPKLLFLLFASMFLLYFLLKPKNIKIFNNMRVAVVLNLIFLSIHFALSAISPDVYRAFIGDYGRNNGFLEYLCFSIFFLATIAFIQARNVKNFFISIYVTSMIVSLYAILQTVEVDFINYTEAKQVQVTTFGNVNFTSSFIGLTSIVTALLFSNTAKKRVKIFYIFSYIIQISSLLLIDSKQGLIVTFISLFLYIGILLRYSRKKISFMWFTLGAFTFCLSFLALFQIGPLAKLIYEPSIGYRGDYFSAAWRMFKSHPVSGVGIESFSDYYRQYIDLNAISGQGSTVNSHYAHNIFLQFLSTGGILLGVTYFMLICYVTFRVFLLLKKSARIDEVYAAGLASIWFSYLIQLQISIEHLGIGLIGWIIAGLIVSLSTKNSNFMNNDIVNSKLIRMPKKIIFILLPLSALLIFGSTRIAMAEISFNNSMNDGGNIQVQEQMLLKATQLNPLQQHYLTRGAVLLINGGLLKSAQFLNNQALLRNPRDLDALTVSIFLAEQSQDYEAIISFRSRLVFLDPFNFDNYLKLGEVYTKINDKEEVKKLINRLENRGGFEETVASLKLL